MQLFGPRWNSEVPRFASNLGFSPLVPQKASTNNGDTLQILLPSFDLSSEMKQHSVSETSESSSQVGYFAFLNIKNHTFPSFLFRMKVGFMDVYFFTT